jgi:ribonucleoside-diphosphate reductase subunit M2
MSISSNTPPIDPILAPNLNRFTLFPIVYNRLWDFYKKAESSFWTASEIDLSKDKFEKLTIKEQHFVKHILAFFASADGVIIENLCANFLNDVQIAEARAFYTFQAAIEQIHSETYALLIDTYVKNKGEKIKLFNAIQSFPCINKKYEWAKRYMTSSKFFATRLIAFACIEGIFFSGAFCAIFWLKKRGLMPGLAFSNELISRDEGLHCDFAVELHRTLQKENQCPIDKIKQIIQDAVLIEKQFVCEALPVGLIGMNSKLMSKYVEFVADRLSKELGAGAIFDTQNPFEWMETISLRGKTNFFENRVSEYQLASNIGGSKTFNLSDDF